MPDVLYQFFMGKNKLLKEFSGKQILDISYNRPLDIAHDLTKFPWPISENAYDLVICQHLLEHLPDTPQTLEELNRITKPGGKIFIETTHFTRVESHHHKQRFSFGFFDYFIKGNPFYKTDFHITDKYINFDDLMFFLGIGFLANRFPSQYEKRLAFIIPASSFQITLSVDK